MLVLALQMRREVNDTLHREDVSDRATEALEAVIEPGGAPFILFVLLVVVLSLRELLLRIETGRILKIHESHATMRVCAPKDHKHED